MTEYQTTPTDRRGRPLTSYPPAVLARLLARCLWDQRELDWFAFRHAQHVADEEENAAFAQSSAAYDRLIEACKLPASKESIRAITRARSEAQEAGQHWNAKINRADKAHRVTFEQYIERQENAAKRRNAQRDEGAAAEFVTIVRQREHQKQIDGELARGAAAIERILTPAPREQA